MADTTLTEVVNQIQTIWSPLMAKELREDLLLGALVNKSYEGDIRRRNDTVRVSLTQKLVGELKDVGSDADTFTPEAMAWSHVDLKADKRALASTVFDDLIQIQSIVDQGGEEVRGSMRHGMEKQINDYLYSLVAPTVTIGTTPNLTATVLADVNKEANEARWPRDKPWYGLVSPQYYADLLKDSVVTSSDFTGGRDVPVIGGQFSVERFGFNLLVDNSRTGGEAIFFHPDFLLLAMQTEPNFKLSDRHSNNEFKMGMSVDTVFGAKLNVEGADLHIKVTTA